MLKRMDEIIRGNRGYQLAEVLVVIAIIATITAIGMPAIVSQMSHLRLTRSVRNVNVELNAARLKAIAQNTKYRISFTLYAGSTPDVFALQKWDIGTASYVSETSSAPKSVESGINISNPSASFTTEFFPNGTATATSICVENTSTSNDRMKITVQGSTGMITVQTGC